jgi:Aminoglycoside-2''-adenylyltransferase
MHGLAAVAEFQMGAPELDDLRAALTAGRRGARVRRCCTGPPIACSLLSKLTVPYWIIGGWAIDLAVGRVTHDHADVDVMLLERDKHALWNDLPRAEVRVAGRGRQPRHLILHSKNLLLPTEVFLAQADGTFWVHRRGAYRFKRPLADITTTETASPSSPPR